MPFWVSTLVSCFKSVLLRLHCLIALIVNFSVFWFVRTLNKWVQSVGKDPFIEQWAYYCAFRILCAIVSTACWCKSVHSIFANAEVSFVKGAYPVCKRYNISTKLLEQVYAAVNIFESLVFRPDELFSFVKLWSFKEISFLETNGPSNRTNFDRMTHFLSFSWRLNFLIVANALLPIPMYWIPLLLF